MNKKTYRRHKKPSDRQLKVVALLQENPKLSPTEAARLAGYSPNTAKNVGVNIMQKPLVQTLLDNYKYELRQHNINPARLAGKLDGLLEASVTKTVKDIEIGEDGKAHRIYREVQEPDHKIQLETIKVLHDIYGVKADPKEGNGVKRRMTIEEFEEKEVLQG